MWLAIYGGSREINSREPNQTPGAFKPHAPNERRLAEKNSPLSAVVNLCQKSLSEKSAWCTTSNSAVTGVFMLLCVPILRSQLSFSLELSWKSSMFSCITKALITSKCILVIARNFRVISIVLGWCYSNVVVQLQDTQP